MLHRIQRGTGLQVGAVSLITTKVHPTTHQGSWVVWSDAFSRDGGILAFPIPHAALPMQSPTSLWEVGYEFLPLYQAHPYNYSANRMWWKWWGFSGKIIKGNMIPLPFSRDPQLENPETLCRKTPCCKSLWDRCTRGLLAVCRIESKYQMCKWGVFNLPSEAPTSWSKDEPSSLCYVWILDPQALWA